MAADYAEMISEELEPPVDVIGISTGGSVALQFAADHPGLLRRLVVHSAAYRLGPGGKQLQLEVRDLVREGKWRQACTALARSVLGSGWYWGPPAHVMGLMMATMAPDDPSDMITTIEAEDRFDLGPRLGDIQTPTLVMAGSADPFYTEELFRETAAGIPNGRLALYPGMGHPAKGPQFRRDLREFLGETP
jgi:pimeloyl-ACP methyl ester carboxylesterase